MKRTVTLLLSALLLQLNAQQLNEVMSIRMNGKGDFSDKAKDICVDNAGNIYLGGYTTTTDNHDWLVIKLNSNGDTLWTRTYNGTDNSEDEVKAIAVDASGNVYATGYSKSSLTGDDYTTIKYNSTGVQQWISFYNGPVGQDDVANDIAVDGSGNVFVTGASAQDATGVDNDFATVKYNANGQQVWAIVFDGAGGGNDEAKRVILDDSGNPVITGQSFNGSDDDWVTRKLNASNGATLWTNYVDYTKNDRPSDMVRDQAGNIYVAGRTKANNYDLAVRKMDNNGATTWTKFFQGTDDDRATALAVDTSGNVYVTGLTDINANPLIEDYNVITIKYNSAGTQQWLKAFDGLGNAGDYSDGIAVNSLGDVFVNGTTASGIKGDDYLLLKYNNTGTLQYAKAIDGGANLNDDGACMALWQGYPVISGGAFVSPVNMNVVTLKYTVTADSVWVKEYHGAGDNNDVANKLVLDAAGNAYLAGYTENLNEDHNFYLAMVNGAGVNTWSAQITGTSGVSPDEATAVYVDAGGNIIATGYVKDSAESYNYCTVTFNNLGLQQWVTKFNYGNGSDKAVGMGLDAAGNIYVAGRSDGDISATATDYDYGVVKYNSNGAEQWSHVAGNAGNADEPVAVVVSNSGNMYVTGRTTVGTNDDVYTVKYNNGGALQWQKYLGRTKDDRAEAMLLDASENLYICGRSEDANGVFDGMLLKYNSNGDTLWTRYYNGLAGGEDRFNALAIDKDGNIVVAGKTDPDNDTATINFDYLLAKYDANGNLVWDTTWTYSSTSDEVANAVAVNDSNSIFVTGEGNTGSGTMYDFVTLAFDKNQQQTASARYGGPIGASKARCIAVKGTGVFVAGASTATNGFYDAALVRYDIVSGLTATTNDKLTVFPNPFSDYVTLVFEKEMYDADLQLLDATGKLMQNYRVEGAKTFTLHRNNLAAGVYFLRMLNANGLQVGIAKIIAY